MVTVKDIPPRFHHVRLVLAREKEHPDGDRETGYDLLVPLDEDHRLDPQEWKKHQPICRVRQFDRHGDVKIGLLRRKAGGQWYFDYEEGESDDETGFRLGEERFVTGEYVSIRHGEEFHPYRVVRVERP